MCCLIIHSSAAMMNCILKNKMYCSGCVCIIEDQKADNVNML